jgi:recombination protein RecT
MAKYALKYSPSIPKTTKLETLIELANKEPEAKKVGWLGNFNDMAVKTVIRRLISKYGYMSIQMQTAIANDINSDQSMNEAERDMTIANAQVEVIATDEAEFEEIDTETGEVKQPESNQPQTDNAIPEPGY